MEGQSNTTELKRIGDIGILELNNPPENYLMNPEFIALDSLRNFVESGIKGLTITGAE